MVRFVDLDVEFPTGNLHSYPYRPPADIRAEQAFGELTLNGDLAQAHAPATERLFTQILQCYPLLATVVRHLDLNDLHNLAASCRPFRKILLPQKRNLVDLALRCGQYDEKTVVRTCVRDLVRECMVCQKSICRNCTYKRKLAGMSGRKRQLCNGCKSDPEVISSEPCDCPVNSWMCYSCGIRTDRTTYHYQNRWTARVPLYTIPHREVFQYQSAQSEPETIPKYLFPCARAYASAEGCPRFEHEGGKDAIKAANPGETGTVRTGGDSLFLVLTVQKEEDLRNCDSKGLVKGGSGVPGEVSWCAWCRRVVLPEAREIAEAAMEEERYGQSAVQKESRYSRMTIW